MMTEVEKICSYFERNSQLRVLFIFDNRMLADTLKDVDWEQLGYRYVVFNGSWFKTKYNIYHEWANDKIILLFPNRITPLGNYDAMKKFPLLDVLVANMEYKPTSHEQFMQEYGIPIQFAEYVSKHVSKLDQVQVKRVLQNYYNADAFNTDIANRGLLSVALGQDHLLDWIEIIVRTIIVSNSNRSDSFFRNLQKDKDVATAIDNKLRSVFGATIAYNKELRLQDVVEVLKYNAITQTMPLDTHDPYKTLKITDAEKLHLANSIIEYALSNAKLSEPFAEAINKMGNKVHDEEIIRIYGLDADYHFMGPAMSYPIIKEIVKHVLPEDAEGTLSKISQLFTRICFDKENTETILDYVELVASLKLNLKELSNQMFGSVDDFVAKYSTELYKSDMYYRLSLEAFSKVICSDPELDDILKALKEKCDADYIYQANIMNRKWIEALKQNGGFQTTKTHYLQQNFYQDFVATSNGKTVVIVIDALRYELAKELLLNLAKDHNTAELYPSLAMVPTETKYCKSALLPHNSISFKVDGIEIDGKIVDGIQPRSKYLSEHVTNAEVLDFENVLKFKDDDGRSYFTKQRPLTYIMHKAIDELCHPYPSAENFTTTCRTAIENIRTLVRKLHNSWFVNKVIITSDHGFVYNDIKIEGPNLESIDDNIYEKEKGSRYYLTESDKASDKIAKFPLYQVSAFQDELKVGIPYGTMRLSGHSGYNFAHGGASLQEVVIPVIVSSMVKDTTVPMVGVNLIERNLSVVSSMLKFNLIQSEPVSMDHRERNIMCALYDNDKLVSDEICISLTSSEELPAKRIEPVILKVSNVKSALLKLKIFNVDKDKSVDYLNPLIATDVTNNTLIERDEF